jgi:S-adenosylmethionine synthetase
VKLNDGEIAGHISKLFDMRPNAIVKRLGLKNPIFVETASYGHMGREPFVREITVKYGLNGTGETRKIKAQFFAWEKLDMVPALKKAFKI